MKDQGRQAVSQQLIPSESEVTVDAAPFHRSDRQGRTRDTYLFNYGTIIVFRKIFRFNAFHAHFLKTKKE